MADKPEYPSSFSSTESSGDQGSSDYSSSDTIRSESENNAEALEVSELVTGISSSFGDGPEMRGALNVDEIGSDPFPTDEEYPPNRLSSTLPPDRSISPEPIGPERSKAAKQSRKPTASAKSADDKKTPKRSKQARVSDADNTGLGVLQQALTDYFKDQMQSTGDLSRRQSFLKKTESMLRQHQNETKKLQNYQIDKVNEVYENEIASIQHMFEDHHVNQLTPAFRQLEIDLNAVKRRCNTMIYWMQRAMMKYFPDDYDGHP